MNTTEKEQDLLNKLNIDKSRKMTNESFIEINSNFHNMPAEAVKKFLEQVPVLLKTSGELVRETFEVYLEAIRSNSSGQDNLYEVYNTELNALQARLDKGGLSFEEESQIFDRMRDIRIALDKKDTENKEFLVQMVRTASSVTIVVFGIIAGIMGTNLKFNPKGLINTVSNKKL